MKILSAPQMRELDRLTVEINNETSHELMLRAAAAFCEAFCKRWDEDTPVTIFAGPGNNGGDALAVAKMLTEIGYEVTTFLFNPKQNLSPDCATCRQQLLNTPGHHFTEITDKFDPPALHEEIVVIDGLFGTGLNKPLTGGFASLAKFINASPTTVVAIDMPSGLMSENNLEYSADAIVRADYTFTFQYPKLALMLDGYAPYYGKVSVLNIGLLESVAQSMPTPYQTIEFDTASQLIQPRKPNSHKGTFGTALLIAGQQGMAGAATLAAKACLRSGVGKVAVHTAANNNDILQISTPEAIVLSDKSATHITTMPADLTKYTGIGIGPGIGTHPDTAEALQHILRSASSPLVVDADALNLLAQNRHLLSLLPKNSILTPHPGELQRIAGTYTSPENLLQKAIQLSTTSQTFVILKGHHTAICTPAGEVYFNTTGNAGMATAGAGDVLTGILTSLLAQGYSPLDTCILGVYLHGLAGDKAKQRLGQHALIASDIIQHLHEAFRDCSSSISHTSSL